MSRPWDNEPTPLTDVVERNIGDSPFLNWAAMKNHARDLERRLRHAERLLAEVRDHRLLPWDDLKNRIDAHLAAKEEGE